MQETSFYQEKNIFKTANNWKYYKKANKNRTLELNEEKFNW